MKRGIKLFFSIFFLLMVNIIFTHNVNASKLNFSVTAKQPKNQIDKEVSYFDLLLEAGYKQDLTLVFRNSTPNKVTVKIEVNSAKTNMLGVVDYSTNDIEKDESLLYELEDLVEIPETIELAPNSEKELSFSVYMPEEVFNGIIAGGLTFSEENSDENSVSSKDNVTITYNYNYVMALLLRQTVSNGGPSLTLKDTRASQLNYRNVILATLSNQEPVFLNQLTTKTTIKRKGSEEALYESVSANMQMAPNSHFDLAVNLNGDKLKPGTYKIEIEAFGQKEPNGQYVFSDEAVGENVKFKYHWRLSEEFIIKSKTANKLNKQDVTIKSDIPMWLYWLILFLLLVIFFLLFLILKKNKDKGQEGKNVPIVKRDLRESSSMNVLANKQISEIQKRKKNKKIRKRKKHSK